MVLGGNQSGKGAKGLLMAKSSAPNNDKNDKKKPVSRSSRAGLQHVESPTLVTRFELLPCWKLHTHSVKLEEIIADMAFS